MKFFSHLSLISSLLYLQVLISLICQINTKNHHKTSKNNQIVLEKPSKLLSVVSPMIEADELPYNSAINISSNQRPGIEVLNAPIKMEHQMSLYSSPVFSVPIFRPNQVTLISKPSQIDVGSASHININHVELPADRNFDYQLASNNNNILHNSDNSVVSHASNLFSNGDIENSLDLYADALANTNNQNQEERILKNIELNNNPGNMANKLEDKLLHHNINSNLINKGRNLIKQNHDNYGIEKDFSCISSENPQNDNNGEIITLEPNKKVLRKDDNISNNSGTVNKNEKSLIKNLLEWAKETGIQVKNLKIDDYPGHSGESLTKAAVKIKKGQTILSIPNKLTISVKNPSLEPLCKTIKGIKSFKSNYDKICMTVFLLTNEEKHFKSYIEFVNINSNFNSFPFFYNKKEIKLLEGSYFNSLVVSREESMNFEYKILKQNKMLSENISKEDYYKARINVMSKNFSVKELNGNYLSVLVPFADLFSHSSNRANVKLEMNKEAGIEIISLHHIEKHAPMYTFYGRLSNYHYLLYYGFVEKHNPVPIQISLALKIKNGRSDRQSEEVTLSTYMKLNTTLKNFRKIVSNFNNNDTIKKHQMFDNPISLENETESLKLLKTGLRTQLKKYHTSLQQDLEKIQSSQHNRNMYNILNILIEEKRIIIKYFNAALIFYKMLKRAQEINNKPLILTKKISKLIEGKKLYKLYFILLKKTFNLEIELNNKIDEDNLDVEKELENEDYVDDYPEANNSGEDYIGDLREIKNEGSDHPLINEFKSHQMNYEGHNIYKKEKSDDVDYDIQVGNQSKSDNDYQF